MKYFRICPYCHANLDPGERCDCRARQEVHAAGTTHRNERQDKGYATERRAAVREERPAWKL